MMLTLLLNLRWGMAASLVATVCSSLVHHYTNTNDHAAKVFGWNFIMRLAIFLLDRIRWENSMFTSRSSDH